MLLFSCRVIFFPVISLAWCFYSIVRLAAKSALKENAELGADLRNQTQNRKCQGNKHRVQVSLSWSGNLCTAILIPWEQDWKSALQQDKQGGNHSLAYSWCMPRSKPHSSKTQTGIMKPCVASWRMWGAAKCLCTETEVWLEPAWQLGSHGVHPKNLSTTWTKAQELGTFVRFTKSFWSELKTDRCRGTPKDNPPR